MKNGRRTLKERLREDMRDPAFRKAFAEEDLPARLAIRIARLREAKGLTQVKLARKLGVSQQALSQLENPETASFTLRTLQRVATALHRKLVVELR